jgi:2-hydroxychromene-2-carboxylate isomerase
MIWYFDFISPFAYLQLPRLLQLHERTPIVPRPIVLAAVLAHHGQLGPAEIPRKREFTYRMVQWQAESSGIDLRFPPSHPFNPLPALRLAIAAGSNWNAVTAIFEHIWKHGHGIDDAAGLDLVAQRLGIADVSAAITDPQVKHQLRANSDAAIARGVFGVPTVEFGGQLFFGNDATPMLEAALHDPERFSGGEYARLAALPIGVERRRQP